MENNQIDSQYSAVNASGNGVRKFLVPAVIALLALAAVISWLVLRNSTSTLSQKANVILSSKMDIRPVSEQSFGDLGGVQFALAKPEENQASAQGQVAKVASAAQSPAVKGMDTGEMYPYPGPVNYIFKYKGDALPVLGEYQDVFRRKIPAQDPSLWSRLTQALPIGLLDLTKLQNTKISTFSLIEDRDYGYNTDVDMNNGTATMYQNYNRWPQTGFTEIMDKKDVPGDAEVIKIAQSFLDQYGISIEGYGLPKVDNSWMVYYERSTEDKMAYLPQVLSVTYPLLIDGREVSHEYGGPDGLRVDVDVRLKRVSGVYDISTRQFERSLYPGEQDTKRLIEIAEQGGWRNSVYKDPSAKDVILELGTPSLKIVKMWYNLTNEPYASSIYAPILIFPIKNYEKAGYWQTEVMVPLVKQMLDNQDGGTPVPMPLSMPMQ